MVRSRYSRYCASGRYDTTLYPTPEALYDELERRCSVDLRVPLQAAATSDGWVDMLAVGARARSRREWRACLEIPGKNRSTKINKSIQNHALKMHINRYPMLALRCIAFCMFA